MNFLYIDKRQRIYKEKKLTKRATRIKEELEAKGWDYTIGWLDELDIYFNTADSELEIYIQDKPLSEYTHILFGGHYTRRQYEIKKLIIEYAEMHDIKIQNSEFMKNMPYYTKLGMANMCRKAGVPHLLFQYNTAGDYKNSKVDLPYVIKHMEGTNDIIKRDGKKLVKKNVFLVEELEDYDKGRLAGKDLTNYFLQERADASADYRFYVSHGEVKGGFKRTTGDDGFMTVNRNKGSEYFYENNPDQEIKDICKKAAEVWGADFMALDFIYDGDDPYILEFSMHPGFTAYETKTQEGEPINVAKTIIESFRD